MHAHASAIRHIPIHLPARNHSSLVSFMRVSSFFLMLGAKRLSAAWQLSSLTQMLV
jgi:hypothetical protein